MSIAHDSRLLSSAENASLMIQVASECALPIPENVMNAILTVTDCDQLDTLTKDNRIAFWVAYSELCDLLHPITIDSILSNYPPVTASKESRFWFWRRSRRSLSERCVTRYRILSMSTLFLLIAIQIYWYVGYALVLDINTQNQNISALNDRLVTLSKQTTRNPPQDHLSIDHPRALELGLIRDQLNEHLNWRDAATNHLQNWNEVWSNLDVFTYQPWQDEDFKSYSKAIQKRIQFVAAENTLQAISEYLLPILYGLIGACFYILRQLPREISSLIFSRNSYINYNLRLAQGPLAGMMISFFIHPTSGPPKPVPENIEQLLTIDPGDSSLSPLALAFLAGYSIDFIFRFLDKILMTMLYENDGKTSNEKNLKIPEKAKLLKKNDNSV